MKKFKSILSGIIILLVLSSGCKKESIEQIAEPLKAEDHLNISYGANTLNTLDIYLPEARDENTPVILLIHGGSWFEGDKAAFTDLAKYWRDKGYAAATMNYRLTNSAGNNIHPAQVNDIAKAIDFIGSKSEDWELNPDKFALQGASAGAHLALLYTYKYNTNNKVKAVISMAGPTDLTNPQMVSPVQVQVVAWLIGTTFQANPAAYAEASPLSQVNAKSKPTLMFHGMLDVIVPFQQSVDLKSRLDQYGIDKKLVLYPDTGHEVLNLANTASFLADCENWFKLYLK